MTEQTPPEGAAPRVLVIVEIEAAPRIVVEAACEADRRALKRWVRECRPDVDLFLTVLARELHERAA